MSEAYRKPGSLAPHYIVLLSVIFSALLVIGLTYFLFYPIQGWHNSRLLLLSLLDAIVISGVLSFFFAFILLRRYRENEAALKSSETFLNIIFQSIRDPFSIVDSTFRIVKVNEAYAHLKNIPMEEMLSGKKCHQVLADSDMICEDCIIQKTFQTKHPCAKEKYASLPDGSGVWMEIYTYPIFNEKREVSHVIEYIRDITVRKKSDDEKKDLIKKLERLSRSDSLTGLLNKRALLDRLEYEVERARRYKADLSIIICDLDHFKEINDTHGHSAGDRVLQLFAEMLNSSVRKADILGRLGGDEFLLIFPQTHTSGAKDFAERLRKTVEKTSFGKDLPALTISLGLAGYAGPGDDHQDLLKRADMALYASKRAGRNRLNVA